MAPCCRQSTFSASDSFRSGVAELWSEPVGYRAMTAVSLNVSETVLRLRSVNASVSSLHELRSDAELFWHPPVVVTDALALDTTSPASHILAKQKT